MSKLTPTGERANILINAKKEDPFARIPKTILSDSRLSWKAKGILCYLLSKPTDWKTRVKDVCKQATEREFSVRSGLYELRKFGYARLEKVLGDNGRVLEWLWRISDEPIFLPDEGFHKVVKPDGGFPDVDRPDVENHDHTKKDSNKNDSTKKEGLSVEKAKKPAIKTPSPSPKNGAAPLPELPEELVHLKAEWIRWGMHRREMGKPLTAQTAREHIELMEAMSDTEVREAIRYSINGGYPALYPPKKRAGAPTQPAECRL